MTYRTCTGCTHGHGFCAEREKVREQVAGLGVSSIKWKCAWRRPAFRPGDLVWATTVSEWQTSGDDGEPVINDYAATAIQNFGSKLLVFIKPGSFELDLEDGDYAFTPRNGGAGFCKVTLTRIRRREGVRENVCHYCRQITGSQGHAEYCPSVPNGWGRSLPERSAER